LIYAQHHSSSSRIHQPQLKMNIAKCFFPQVPILQNGSRDQLRVIFFLCLKGPLMPAISFYDQGEDNLRKIENSYVVVNSFKVSLAGI